MRIMLRCLIALNWITVGLGCNLFYANHSTWWGCCFKLAKQDADAKFPGGVVDDSQLGTLVILDEQGYRFLRERSAIYEQRAESSVRVGDLACGLMIVVGAATSLGLMAVFPKKVAPPES